MAGRQEASEADAPVDLRELLDDLNGLERLQGLQMGLLQGLKRQIEMALRQAPNQSSTETPKPVRRRGKRKTQ